MGREEGREMGELQAKHAIALKLIVKGKNNSEISDLTDLSIEDIQSLR